MANSWEQTATKKLSDSTRRKQRQEQARERQESYAKLSAKERGTKLDERLGNGVGAKKQRSMGNKDVSMKNVRNAIKETEANLKAGRTLSGDRLVAEIEGTELD